MENINSNTEEMLSSIGAKDNDSNSSDKLKSAHDMYNSGRYAEVISLLEKTPSLLNEGHTHVLLGNCYKQTGNKVKAMEEWSRAVDLSPMEYTAYMNIAAEEYASKDIYKAIYNWHTACTICPENANINLNLAIAYNEINNRIKSTIFFERYLRFAKSTSIEYMNIKRSMTNLKARADYYSKKLTKFKLERNLQGIAAVYLKMISTYSNLPAIYNNIAELFNYDKNYEKALEFYLILYLNYPHTLKVLIEIANLCILLNRRSYAYVYYKRAIGEIPEGTDLYNKIKAKLESLSDTKDDSEIIGEHLQKAKEAEQVCKYEVAIDEYENYLILTETENPEIQSLIDKYKIFHNPDPFVISVLYSYLNDLMTKKKLRTCIEVCDRIIKLATENCKEVMYAMKCKTECKRILFIQEHNRV